MRILFVLILLGMCSCHGMINHSPEAAAKDLCIEGHRYLNVLIGTSSGSWFVPVPVFDKNDKPARCEE